MITILLAAAVLPQALGAVVGAIADVREDKPINVRSIVNPCVLLVAGPPFLALLAGPAVADAIVMAPMAQARERKVLLDWMRDQKLGVMPMSDDRRDWGLIHVEELARWERTQGKDPKQHAVMRARKFTLGPIFAAVPEMRKNFGITKELTLDESWG